MSTPISWEYTDQVDTEAPTYLVTELCDGQTAVAYPDSTGESMKSYFDTVRLMIMKRPLGPKHDGPHINKVTLHSTREKTNLDIAADIEPCGGNH